METAAARRVRKGTGHSLRRSDKIGVGGAQKLEGTQSNREAVSIRRLYQRKKQSDKTFGGERCQVACIEEAGKFTSEFS